MIDGQTFPLTEAESMQYGTAHFVTRLVDGGWRIYSAEGRWMHPDKVPTRVLRGDPTIPLPGEFWRAYIATAVERDRLEGRHKDEKDEDGEVIVKVKTWPAPEVPERPATLEEIPPTLRSIGRLASDNGFELRCTYAKGPRLDQYLNVAEISESVVVQGRHADGRAFVAGYITKTGQRGSKEGVTEWKPELAYLLEDGVITPCSVTAIRAYCH